MGLRKTRRRLLKPWPFLEKAACSLSLLVVALSDGNYSCCRGAAAAGAAEEIERWRVERGCRYAWLQLFVGIEVKFARLLNSPMNI